MFIVFYIQLLFTSLFLFQVADLKNKLETEKGKDAYPKSNVRLIYAGKYINYVFVQL